MMFGIMKCPHCGRKEKMFNKGTYYKCSYCGKKINYDGTPIIEPTCYDQRVMICPICGNISLSDGYNSDNPSMNCSNCNSNMINTQMTGYVYGEACMEHRREELDKTLRENFTFNNPNFNKTEYEKLLDAERQKKLNQLIYTGRTSSQTNTINNTQSNNIPKCPTCGSTNIEKISAGKKLVGSTLFGIFSKDAKSTFHCKNCNYKW